MKSKERLNASIAKPLVKELVDRHNANTKQQTPSVGSTPLNPPSQYQDAGNGYNSDFTFPQQ